MSKDDDPLPDELIAEAMGQLIPVVGGPLGRRLMRPIRQEWKRNTSTALGAAEAASGLSREDLLEFMEKDSRAVPLYLHVLWAAGMNGHDATLRAMGAVFGDAAHAARSGDDARLEDLETSLRAMSNLGPRHFRSLKHLIANPPSDSGSGGKSYANCTPNAVAQALGLSEDSTHQCLFNMIGAGLVTQATGLLGGGTGYEATALGEAVERAVQHVSNPS